MATTHGIQVAEVSNQQLSAHAGEQTETETTENSTGVPLNKSILLERKQ